MPENLQGGSKAQELEEAISEIDTVADALDTIESASPEFPGMR